MSVAAKPFDARQYQAERNARERKATRDLLIPAVVNPDRRAEREADDCLWLSTYLKSANRFYNPFTPDQRDIIAECGEALRHGTSKCRAQPRGDGKSTITTYLMLKYGLAKVIRFGLILAATTPKAGGSLKNIKRTLRDQTLTELREDYPLETSLARYVGPAPSRCNNVTITLEGTDVEKLPVHVEWGPEHVIMCDAAGEISWIIAALGILSESVQGCNYYDIRPDFTMLDDLDSRDSLAAAEGVVAAKIEHAIDSTVAGLGGPNRSFGQMMLCTIPSRESAAYRYSDPEIKPAYSGVRVSRIKKWPTNSGMWDEYVHKRNVGQSTKGADGKPIDPHGRDAHKYYEANRAAMDEGAELSNPYDYSQVILPDGSPTHLSALQKCYDYIAKNGMDSFLTEHQNDPPEDDKVSRLLLTAHHIQHNRLSGLDRSTCPDGTELLTIGSDVQKRGLHWVAVAWSSEAVGCIVEYDFFEFGLDGKPAAECELGILEGLWSWHTKLEEMPFMKSDGEVVPLDLCLIDMGWKDEAWNAQPVSLFCSALGNHQFKGSKGIPNYRSPKPSRTMVVGDHWHIDHKDNYPFVGMNSDHWKLKVHEGFLGEPGSSGSLALFNHPTIDGRIVRNHHLSYAKHIVSESWDTRNTPGFNLPRTGWFSSRKPNHYFDATYAALVARSVRGLNAIASAEIPSEAKAAAEAPRKPQPQVTERRSAGRRRINFRRR